MRGLRGKVAIVTGGMGTGEATALRLAEEIGAGTTVLLSEDASFVTGAELVVDGGYTAK